MDADDDEIERMAAEFHARMGPEKAEIDGVVFDGTHFMAWGSNETVPRPTNAWLREQSDKLWPISRGWTIRDTTRPELNGRWEICWLPSLGEDM